MSRRRGYRVLLGVLVCPWVVLVTAPVASAVPRVVTDPTFGPPLTTIKVTGAGFCVTCGPASIQIGSLYVATNIQVTTTGRFSTFVRVPGTTRPGTVPVIASQKASDGSTIHAESDFTVTVNIPPPTTYPPPTTQPPPGGLPSATAPHTSTSPVRPPSSTGTPLTASSGSATSTPSSGAASTAGTASPSGETPGTGPTATAGVSPGAAADTAWLPATLVAASLLALAGATAWVLRRRRRNTTH